jgi:glutaredoxin
VTTSLQRHGSALSRGLAVSLALLFALLSLPGSASAESSTDIVMWGHPGCPHCRAAHAYLDGLRTRRPDLVIVEHDVTEDQASLEDLRARSLRAGLDMVGLPSFLVRGTFFVGFASAEATGSRIEALLPRAPSAAPSERASAPPARRPSPAPPSSGIPASPAAAPSQAPAAASAKAPPTPGPSSTPAQRAPAHAPGSDEPRVPSVMSPPASGDGEIELPWFGRVSARKLGLPAFTVAVGLVDGFNPCAMWVLLFLLSLLVNIKSRRRMLAIAGSFVLVSGLAYYAFMAAWLNVFTLVGLSRVVQIVLGVMALVIGAVNVKDFFAFEKGISFSIPDRAKPGIYARVRAIVRAESLGAAIAGATVLAVLVNVIELVCTAGLPALYTQVLVQQGVSRGERYGYLALYNLAYMLDDSLMVGIAVVTLGKRKLQERAGRWLKLLSGAVILLLGSLLIFAPQALLW